MIKIDEGHVNITGRGLDVLAELGTLAAALYEMLCEDGMPKDKSEELIFDAVTVGIRLQETSGKGETSTMKMADEIVKKILKGEKADE